MDYRNNLSTDDETVQYQDQYKQITTLERCPVAM